MPIDITYDNTSNLNTVDNLNFSITTTLNSYITDEYIESTIVFTVLRDVVMNETELECISEALDVEFSHSVRQYIRYKYTICTNKLMG